MSLDLRSLGFQSQLRGGGLCCQLGRGNAWEVGELEEASLGIWLKPWRSTGGDQRRFLGRGLLLQPASPDLPTPWKLTWHEGEGALTLGYSLITLSKVEERGRGEKQGGGRKKEENGKGISPQPKLVTSALQISRYHDGHHVFLSLNLALHFLFLLEKHHFLF